MKTLKKLISLILTISISTTVNGFVFAKLWLWFVVPTFLIQELRLAEAIGVVMLIGFATKRKIKKTKKEEKKAEGGLWDYLLESSKNTIAVAIMFLTVGYIVSQFI
jgi:hypothetical protein